MSDSKTFRVETRDDGVAVVWMDVPGEPVNTLKASFADEFEELFAGLAGDANLRAVVFASAKPGNFLAGADIKMLEAAKTAEEAAELSRRGQHALERVASLPLPVVAAIDGACLGGGLEVALACDARVASDNRKTKLGLPEVQLGLLPGAGGTQRLPRLVGVQAALDLLLTGKQLNARRAKKLGLVDEVVPVPIVVDVAVRKALELADRREPPLAERVRGLLSVESLQELGLAGNPIGRAVVFNQAGRTVRAKTHGNYPAPEKILEVVKVGLEQGFEKGLEAEARAFGELVVSDVARQLMGIYFATQALKKDTGVDDPEVRARPIEKVGVLGGGLMGSGIAYATASLAELPVRIKEVDHAGVGRGLASVRKLLDERVKRRRMSALERNEVMARVSGTAEWSGFSRAGVVVEAVFEDLELKRQMVRAVEEHGPAEVIFASNTSSLPIGKIAEASAHPETVIGMHYFSPVHKMPLLEIVVTERTAPWVIATCVALGKAQRKTVIVVRDGVGFYTSRILAPYMNEAAYILSEGVPVERIDAALTDYGFPVGPIVLMDEVGIDVGEKVGKIMLDAFGARMTPPACMQKLIEDQRYGRKNKRGFYRYDGKGKGKKEVDESVYEVLGVKPTARLDSDVIAERCALQMINEAARCFGEGILRSARDGDIGAIFGLGFPPFRGGPFRTIDALGPAHVLARLEHYQGLFGERFAPAPLLRAMAAERRCFYGEDAVRPATHREA
ncbi:MAG: fatty acid oxidation complex subunit alpha FadJ [Planctomycetota bacterium]|nr:MAG: fatty acid oxidation complex subunit alpha FadJ [Planctomycetota bacterium]